MAQNDNNAAKKNATQDQDKPINGTQQGAVLTNVQIRAIDRTPDSIQKWRSGIIAAESPYYPVRQRLYDIYSNIELDGHLGGIIDKRIDTVLNKDLYFEKLTGKKQGEYERDYSFDQLIHTDMFRRYCREIIRTQLWGRTGFEFVVGKDFNWKEIPRKHIQMKTQKIVYEQYGMDDGVSYTDLWNVIILGQSKDLGLLASVAQYALLKRGVQADWANYVEIFGMPQWVFKYDAWDEQTKKELDKIIDNMGSFLRVRIPREAEAMPIDAKSSNGNGELQEKLFSAMNAEMSIRILGVTETTTSSKGSGYAQSKTHQDQQKEIIKSDMVYLTNMLNSPQFLNVLKTYGYKVENGRFAFTKEIDIDFLKEKIKVDTAAINTGLPVSQKYFYDTYGIPMPEPGDALMEPLGAAAIDDGEEESEEDIEPKNSKGKTPAKRPAKKPKQPKNLGSFMRSIRNLSNFFD